MTSSDRGASRPAEALTRELVRGIEFGSGVPDSTLSSAFERMEHEAGIRFVGAPREDIAGCELVPIRGGGD